MMGNAQVCGLLHGAMIVLYDGTHPRGSTADRLWRIAAEHGVTVFGTSPGYLKRRAARGRELLKRYRAIAQSIVGVG